MSEQRLINANELLDLFYVAAVGQDKQFVRTVEMVVSDTPTVDAVPISELKELRDYLYEQDLIFMHGLQAFNRLIEKYDMVMENETDEVKK